MSYPPPPPPPLCYTDDKTLLDIQNSTSGALTPGKDRVWETGRPTLRKWQGKSLKKMHIGVGNMKKADDKKSKKRKKKEKEKKSNRRGQKEEGKNCRKWGWRRN